MQQLGAIAIKQAVYVLPDTATAREDFEWLRTEVTSAGGAASVFTAVSVDAWNDDTLIEEFRRTRQAAYRALAEDLDAAQKPRRRPRDEADRRRTVEALRQRFAALERIDFFGSAGRDRVVQQLNALDQRADSRRPHAGPRGKSAPPAYRKRLWVTRPRPGVDRMSSAWLIRRFIDPDAAFGFVADRHAAPERALPFDMFGVELTHRGELCTFEVLCETFGLNDPALTRLAAIVHDLDLKDARFGAPEADAIGLVIDGLQLAHADDQELLAAGMSMFEALYRSSLQSSDLSGPRAVPPPRGTAPSSRTPTRARRKGGRRQP